MTSFRPAPPRIGSDIERRALIDSFTRTQFSETAVCASLGIVDFDALEGDGREQLAVRFVERDPRSVFIRVFVLGSSVDAEEFDAVLAPHESAAFRSLGLVQPISLPTASAPSLFSPIRLVPLSDGSSSGRTLLIASDRGDTPDGSRFEPFSDIVFSGHNPLTRQFLRLLPTTRTKSVLELCAGTAVAALVSEATADRVTAADLTERCTEFARFNGWLNGSERVEIRQGDLYDPVRDERFDRILVHPPYVPALSERLIYRDGGEAGDRLLRRIIGGLPDHLNTQGTFHMLSIGMDTTGAPFETRVREWLGSAESEFDIVFAFGSAMAPEEFARSLVTKAADSQPGDYARWMSLFATLHLREVVYGALVARRFEAAAGEPYTRRVVAGPATGPLGFDWLLRWFDWLRRPGRGERVLASRPILSNGAQVDVHHVVQNGEFVPQTFRLANDEAHFRVQLGTDGWIVQILTAFDGNRTVDHVYREASRSGKTPQMFAESDFVDLTCLLVERGFLNLAEPDLT